MYEPLEDEYEKVKVGDKVTMNGAGTKYFTDGKEYEVLVVCEDGTASVITDDSSRCYLGLSKKYLRKVKDTNKTLSKYDRECKNITIDVYDVLKSFNVTNPAIAHAVKKLLVAGKRGYKDIIQDYDEAIASIQRGKDLEDV